MTEGSMMQSGIKSGVGSLRKFAIFLAHSAESSFSQQKVPYFKVSWQKCGILAFRNKTVLMHTKTVLNNVACMLKQKLEGTTNYSLRSSLSLTRAQA